MKDGEDWFPDVLSHLSRAKYDRVPPPESEGMAREIARKYQLAGVSIFNVAQSVLLATLERGDATLKKHDFLNAIQRELLKEGKVL